MEYTQLSDDFKTTYYDRFKFPEKFKVQICREDPVKFAYFMLGKTLWKHQVYLVDAFLNNRHNVWCLPRQTGKSTVIEILALWAAWFNQYNKDIKDKRMSSGCAIYVISRTEDQAKELILKIRELIRDGDAHMSKILRASAKHMTNFFSSAITQPDNAFQITFANGGFIKASPPTDNMRGKSSDIVFIDEAAFLRNENPDKLYAECIEPTVSQTKGKIILSSTPRGQQGFFYKMIDPFDHYPLNDFFKVWFHYSILESEHYLEKIKTIEKERRSKGEGKSFEQEYEAKFVTNAESFFDSDKIDTCCDMKHKFEDDKRNEYVIGVDYGMVASRTTIVMSRFNIEEGKIITGYVKRFNQGKDLNDIMPFIDGLRKRFNVTKIVVDDCIDKDTEVLMSDNKPKKICDIKVGDKVMSYDTKTKTYKEELVYGSFDKGMLETNIIKLKNGTTIYATDDHKFWVKNIKTGEVYYKPFNELDETKEKMLINNNFNKNKQIEFNKDKTYLMGMYIAEGSHHVGENRCFIAQDEGVNDKKRDKIETALKNLNMRYTKNNKGFSLLSGQEIVKEFQSYGTYCYNKKLPDEVFDYSIEQLNVLFEGLLDGDGWYNHKTKDKRGYKLNLKYGYSTTSKELNKQLMELSRRIGKPFYSTFRKRKNKLPNWDLTYITTSYFNKNRDDNYVVGWKAIEKEVRHTWDLAVENTNTFILYESGLIIHNCPEGTMINQRMMNKGWNVELFNFTTSKTENYCTYRAKLNQEKIGIYPDKDLMMEMKGLQQEETMSGKLKIFKGGGLTDDLCDALIMSASPWLDEDTENYELLLV